MFRNRNSQKPNDELYKIFKANFPQLGQAATATSSAAHGVTSLTETVDIPLSGSAAEDHAHDLKDAHPTPNATNEPWAFGSSGLTPSVMDPNSHSFHMFASQMPGYYTPTPGGTNTLYHPQAGDLHTPGFGMGLRTPLSLPTSEGGLHTGQHGFHGFPAHVTHDFQQSAFQNINPFQLEHHQSFPPHHFTHQPSFESMEGPVGESPIDDLAMGAHAHQQQLHKPAQPMYHPPSMPTALQPPAPHPSGESFRYHVTLNAPTAMIKHADEIPITYLNKGQAYTLNVIDTQNHHAAANVRYRTFVRVSFEDEQQRLKPAGCWQLWKEGRGTNEAHQRGGRLQAVEYVKSGQLGAAEDPTKPRVQLESASFDGFCVVWSPTAGSPECPIQVRFNFLSTDFSHSKGVKGIPVRLCAKTELISGYVSNSSSTPGPEVCYCKVKLFRDHGAERKLSNDVAHVKKTIDKMNQQIAQVESGLKELGKRKRPAVTKSSGEDRPGKVQKHRRTWSMSSITSTGGRGSAEEDLHMKLMTLQDMFSSTRPASVLYLRGADQDDPDLFPVSLSGEPQALLRTESSGATGWEQQSSRTGAASSVVSPTSSARSLTQTRRDSTIQQPTPAVGISRENSSDWRSKPHTATEDLPPAQIGSQLTSPVQTQASLKVQTRSPTSGRLSGWIEALEVDHTYQAPTERTVKPIACFYVQTRGLGMNSNYHRAVYVTQRTVKGFTNAVASKYNIEPTKILQVVRINRQGLHILFDDDCMRELPEGQDMTIEITEARAQSPFSTEREWNAGPTDVQCDGDFSAIEDVNSTGYELRLLF